jgi:hypothetical protein
MKAVLRLHAPTVVLILAALSILPTGLGRPQETSKELPLEERLKMLEAAMPGVGEIMSGVQLRFAKLHFAAEARNWKLADFDVDEIEENLDKAATLRPVDNGVQLKGILDAFKQTQLATMKQAAEHKDLGVFRRSYTESIAVCNSCREATARPFIVITKPTAPPVSNQHSKTRANNK